MESVFRQTCRDFEVILVDDGSTDSSPALCDGYAAAHPDFVRVVHKANGGLSSARNCGIDAAKGSFVVFPDPDDWLEADYVCKFAELQQLYNADMVCTGYFVDCENSCTPALPGAVLRSLDAHKAKEALLIAPAMIGFAWNKLYRLDIIRNNGIRFLDDVGTTEDLDFACRYLDFCNTVIHDPASRTYHYFQRKGAATHSSFSSKRMDSIHTYEKIIRSCGKDNALLASAAREEICVTAVNLLWDFETAKSTDYAAKQLLKKYIRENLKIHMHSKRYSCTRKAQALAAAFSPGLFTIFKSLVRKLKERN